MSIRKLALGCLVPAFFGVLTAEDPPPDCGGGEEFQFEVQVSLDGGTHWYSGSAAMFVYPGTQVDFAVRTRMTVMSGDTQGWSFSLKHDPTEVQSFWGNVTLSGVTVQGTDTETVQDGNPPDSEYTEIREGFDGYTQGVVIDTDSQITLSPTSDFVTSRACYTIDVPPFQGTYRIPIMFTHDVGDPPIDSIVTQEGQAIRPCAKNMMIYLYVGSFWIPYPTCTIEGEREQGSSLEAEADEKDQENTREIFVYAPPQAYKVVDTGDLTVSAVEAGDFNGDGAPDLVATKTAESAVVIMWNHGDGTFADEGDYQWTEISIFPGNSGRIVSVSVEDIDEDGNMDIAACWRSEEEGQPHDTAWVLWNSGSAPYFSTGNAVYVDVGLNAQSDSIDTGDVVQFTGDPEGSLDIVIGAHARDPAGEYEYVFAAPKTGFRAFGEVLQEFWGGYQGFEYLMVADVNQAEPFYEIVGKSASVGHGEDWPKLWRNPVYYEAGKLDLGHLNSDGYLDFVSANPTNSEFNIARNDGTGNFSLNYGAISERRANRAVALTHIDEDDYLDIAVALEKDWDQDGSTISLHRNTGGETPITDEAHWLDVGTIETDKEQIVHLRAVDLNRDGLEDLFASTDAGYVLVIMHKRGIFQRGDSNNDGGVNIADAIHVLGWLFGGGEAPACEDAADANDDGDINIADAIYILGYLFGGGAEFPPPFGQCGPDPTKDELSCLGYDPANCE